MEWSGALQSGFVSARSGTELCRDRQARVRVKGDFDPVLPVPVLCFG